jgi:putative toxin-antitoxin system antitoxin component (TIGR02293 family)
MANAGTLAIVAVMGGEQVVGPAVRTLHDLCAELRRGLPYGAVEALQGSLKVTAGEVAEALQLPVRTLTRRRQESRLRADESDRVYRLARVRVHAIDVFDSPSKAGEWMRRPNRALRLQAPLSLLDTDIGAQQVEDVLGRIEHGVYG